MLARIGYLNNNGEVSKVKAILSEEKITDAVTAATKRFKMYLGLFTKLDEYARKSVADSESEENPLRTNSDEVHQGVQMLETKSGDGVLISKECHMQGSIMLYPISVEET
uniref:LisH domain-containing protein n=1 Tax=Haemonchus contortus TaxID=6289 RepID=A0A7I4XY56_HAECO|nr:unnamed protein product [Haemonchus contortus]